MQRPCALRQRRIQQPGNRGIDARQMAQRRVQDGADERPVAFAERPIGRIAVFMIKSAVERQLAVDDGSKNFAAAARACRPSLSGADRSVEGLRLRNGFFVPSEFKTTDLLAVANHRDQDPYPEQSAICATD